MKVFALYDIIFLEVPPLDGRKLVLWDFPLFTTISPPTLFAATFKRRIVHHNGIVFYYKFCIYEFFGIIINIAVQLVMPYVSSPEHTLYLMILYFLEHILIIAKKAPISRSFFFGERGIRLPIKLPLCNFSAGRAQTVFLVKKQFSAFRIPKTPYYGVLLSNEKSLAEARLLSSEREGFEPSMPFWSIHP